MFREELLKYAEKLIIERRNRMRARKIDVCKYSIRPELAYEKRNMFVESSIENTMIFFKAHNLKTWAATDEAIDDIKNKVMKNEAKLNKKKGRGRNTGSNTRKPTGSSRQTTVIS